MLYSISWVLSSQSKPTWSKEPFSYTIGYKAYFPTHVQEQLTIKTKLSTTTLDIYFTIVNQLLFRVRGQEKKKNKKGNKRKKVWQEKDKTIDTTISCSLLRDLKFTGVKQADKL